MIAQLSMLSLAPGPCTALRRVVTILTIVIYILLIINITIIFLVNININYEDDTCQSGS